LVQLQKELPRFEKINLQIVGVSYDSVAVLKKFSDQAKLGFPLLSDEGSATIRAYGLLFQKGLPHPGTIIIDQQGVVRAKLLEEGYAKRHTTDDLFEAAKGIGAGE
jgi:peroxiredoxin Q/BCP